MNKQLIEKVINTNNETCPDFTFANPLLDKKVARALSKSFVKILNISKQNLNANNNLRYSILETIRKICQVEPENHIKVDENITELLVEIHQDRVKNCCTYSIDKKLDAFLIKRLKEIDVNPKYKSSVSPEIIQALSNLDEKEQLNFTEDVIHWNNEDHKILAVLKGFWNSDIVKETSIDDISVKVRSEIELILLNNCLSILESHGADIEHKFVHNSSLKNLCGSCSKSPECFQICCSILNYIFIETNFDLRLQQFIQCFIEHVKFLCTYVSISLLYPVHLSNAVLLLDVELSEIPVETRNYYIEITVNNLKSLQKQCKNDFVMLLSHFPMWFDVYYKGCD